MIMLRLICNFNANLCYRSYTTLKYSGMKIEPTIVKAGQNVTVSVSVTNTGSRTSDEVLCSLPFRSMYASECMHTYYSLLMLNLPGSANLHFLE